MRDPNRIPDILAKVELLWKDSPDLRLMQLLMNVIGSEAPCPQLYYLEDDELRKKLGGK